MHIGGKIEFIIAKATKKQAHTNKWQDECSMHIEFLSMDQSGMGKTNKGIATLQ
jgi:hypothetical protein